MAEPRNCLDEAAHLLAAGIINTFTDFVVVLLPIITVMKLQLTTRNRLVVVGLFSLGFLACSVGAFRTYITWHMKVDYDLTYYAGSVFWSSAVELNTGIVSSPLDHTSHVKTSALLTSLWCCLDMCLGACHETVLHETPTPGLGSDCPSEDTISYKLRALQQPANVGLHPQQTARHAGRYRSQC